MWATTLVGAEKSIGMNTSMTNGELLTILAIIAFAKITSRTTSLKLLLRLIFPSNFNGKAIFIIDKCTQKQVISKIVILEEGQLF